MSVTLDLYEDDFYAWTQEQAKSIKERALAKIDWLHLSEEVEDMGDRHADEIESRLKVLLIHLLKWKYQPNLRGRSWQLTIKEQRLGLSKRLKKMPSLNTKLDELFLDAYDSAIIAAEKETGLDESTFPNKCEWTIEQVFDNEFLPQ